MSDLLELDAAQFLVTADCLGEPPEDYIWGAEVIDLANARKVTPRPARGAALPPLPDLYPGRGYYVANSLEAELRDFNYLYPKRAKGTDGWLGDASHSARKSDHNPDYPDGGIIRAGDLTTTSLTEAQDRALIADLIATEKANPVDRLWYIIHRFPGDDTTYIWSRTNDWVRKPYALGRSMPHEKHFHTSIMHTNAAARDTSPWFAKHIKAKQEADAPKPILPAPTVSLAAVVAAFAAGPVGDPVQDVKDVQAALNRALPKVTPALVVDGYPGPGTRARYAAWQEFLGYSGTDADGIPGATSLGRLPLTVKP